MKTLAIAAIVCAVALPQAVHAATFTVTSTADGVDTSPLGDGVCATPTRTCTLRAALMEANALPGADTIILPAGRYELRIPGADEDLGWKGDLDVTEDLTITGAGETTTIIDANHIDRVFDVHSPAQVTISGLTITNGEPMPYSDGGGMLNAGSVTLNHVAFLRNHAGRNYSSGGGLMNSGSATLTHVTFLHNRAGDAPCSPSDCGDDPGNGGGMWNDGMATLTDVIFRGNRAGDTHDGGGTGGECGGLLNDGVAVLTDVTFHANRAGDGSAPGSGGGIENEGTATLTRVTFIHNRAGDAPGTGYGFGGDGGGLLNDSTATLNDVSFIGNRAGRGGGDPGGGFGGHGGGVNNSGTLTITNATFDGNRAGATRFGLAGHGGGMFDTGTATLTNVTLTRNRAGYGPRYAGGDGGGINSSEATLINVTLAFNRAGKSRNYRGGGNQIAGYPTLTNSIIFGPGDSCSDLYGDSESGGVESLGHNLDSGSSCLLTGPGDLSNTNPRLEPLKQQATLPNHGGFTPTLALLPGSPAIDAGDNAACPATDQRGVARPQGATCDIGAYEFHP